MCKKLIISFRKIRIPLLISLTLDLPFSSQDLGYFLKLASANSKASFLSCGFVRKTTFSKNPTLRGDLFDFASQ